MKLISIIVLVILLSACGARPMNQSASDAVTACLEKGWIPRYWSNSIQVDFTCNEKPPNEGGL